MYLHLPKSIDKVVVLQALKEQFKWYSKNDPEGWKPEKQVLKTAMMEIENGRMRSKAEADIQNVSAL